MGRVVGVISDLRRDTKRLSQNEIYRRAGPWTWSALLERLGIEHRVRSTGVVIWRCTFHEENTPSCIGWSKSLRFLCHGCGACGDLASFAEAHGFYIGPDGFLSGPESSRDEHPNQLELWDLTRPAQFVGDT
jgi:hypothetical protein